MLASEQETIYEGGEIYELEDVIGYSDEENEFMLLLTTYTTQVKLSLVR